MTISGIYSNRVPPLPIPNREVKPISADGTAERWESRSMPTFKRLVSNEARRFFYVLEASEIVKDLEISFEKKKYAMPPVDF